MYKLAKRQLYIITWFCLVSNLAITQKPLEHADIYTLHPPGEGISLSVLNDYGIDVIGWGYTVDERKQTIRDMGIEFRTASSGEVWGMNEGSPTADSISRNLLDEKILATGTGFANFNLWHMCGNKPGWNDNWVKEWSTNGLADGWLLDAPIGANARQDIHTQKAACFCDACIPNFRIWLDTNYTDAELLALGIDDVSTYNHKEAVLATGITTVDQYRNAWYSGDIPRAKEYYLFQAQAGVNVTTRMAGLMKEHGPDRPIGSNAWHMAAYNLHAAHFADYFLIEMNYDPGKWEDHSMGLGMVRDIKLAEALGKPIVTNPLINDHNALRVAGYENRIREMSCWAAGTYALGGIHAAPVYYEWSGTPYFNGDPADYAFVYQFIKSHKFLFNGYETYDEGVVLVYDNHADQPVMGSIAIGKNGYSSNFRNSAKNLFNANVQFDLVVCADPMHYKTNITPEALAPYDKVLALSSGIYSGGQLATLEAASGYQRISGNVVPDQVVPTSEQAIVVSDSEVRALIRKHSITGDLAVHLINQGLNYDANVMNKQNDFTVSIKEDVIDGLTIGSIKIYDPDADTVMVPTYQISDGRLEIDIAALNMWSIVHIENEAYINVAPTVSIVAPEEGVPYWEGENIAILAEASDVDGSVTSVEFFDGITSLGVDTISPYSITLAYPVTSSYSFTAVATDDDSASTTSAAVNIEVVEDTRPSVSIVDPVNGAIFTSSDTIYITAEASDNDSIISVEFFIGTYSLGFDSSYPYVSPFWTGAEPGTYKLTALATDNDGYTRISSEVMLTIGTASGENLLTNGDYTDGLNNWSYWNNTDAGGSATVKDGELHVDITAGGNFNYSIQIYQDNLAISSGSEYTVSFKARCASGTQGILPLVQEFGDDFTFYGSNFFSINTCMQTYEFSFTANVTDPAARINFYLGNQGVNEVIIDDVSLTFGEISNYPPDICITDPADQAEFRKGDTISITADATDLDGSVSSVEFFADSISLGSDTTPPYSINWTGAVEGSYGIIAVATDNSGANTTSLAVNLKVGFPLYIANTPKPEQGVFAYPVPASEILYLDSDEAGQLYIYSLDGKIRVQQEYYPGKAIDITGLIKGVYVLRFVGKTSTSFKIEIYD